MVAVYRDPGWCQLLSHTSVFHLDSEFFWGSRLQRPGLMHAPNCEVGWGWCWLQGFWFQELRQVACRKGRKASLWIPCLLLNFFFMFDFFFNWVHKTAIKKQFGWCGWSTHGFKYVSPKFWNASFLSFPSQSHMGHIFYFKMTSCSGSHHDLMAQAHFAVSYYGTQTGRPVPSLNIRMLVGKGGRYWLSGYMAMTLDFSV